MPRLAPWSLWLACSLLATPVAAAPSAPAKTPAQTAAEERIQLQQLELGVRRGQTRRALAAAARALKRAPTPRLLLRYAELALPLTPRPSSPELASQRKAAQLIQDAISRPDFRADELAHQLTFHAAWAKALLGAYAESLVLLEQVTGLDPSRGLPYLRALAALALRGDPGVSERALVSARSFAPSDETLLAELGLLWLAHGRAHHALPLLAERYARDPARLSARRDYAYALSAVGRPAEAQALLSVVREPCRAADVCALELARFALEARDYASALSEVSAFEARAPEELAALFLEADVHLARGEADRARAAYKRILELAPDNLRARAALTGLREAASDGRN